MERLTEYMGNGENYESINPIDTHYEYGKANLQALINKLAAYEDAEEQGLLLQLPAPLDGVERFSLDGKTTWQRVYEADMPEGGAAMRENEAIEVLKDFDQQVTAKADGAYQSTIGKMACDTAIKALEEVQQYRTYKEKFKEIYGDCENALEVLLNLLLEYEIKEAKGSYIIRLLTDDGAKRWDEYRAIGTPEECQAAREKQMPKRPKEYEDKYYGCPTCGNVLLHKWKKYPDKLMDKSNGLPYCLGCGQKLNWEDEG